MRFVLSTQKGFLLFTQDSFFCDVFFNAECMCAFCTARCCWLNNLELDFRVAYRGYLANDFVLTLANSKNTKTWQMERHAPGSDRDLFKQRLINFHEQLKNPKRKSHETVNTSQHEDIRSWACQKLSNAKTSKNFLSGHKSSKKWSSPSIFLMVVMFGNEACCLSMNQHWLKLNVCFVFFEFSKGFGIPRIHRNTVRTHTTWFRNNLIVPTKKWPSCEE